MEGFLQTVVEDDSGKYFNRDGTLNAKAFETDWKAIK